MTKATKRRLFISLGVVHLAIAAGNIGVGWLAIDAHEALYVVPAGLAAVFTLMCAAACLMRAATD